MIEANFRGIALLSCIGKFFKVIINERIIKFAIANQIIKQEQFSLVKGYRTFDFFSILHALADYYLNDKKPNFMLPSMT